MTLSHERRSVAHCSLLAIVAATLLGTPDRVGARSLTGQLHQFFDANAFPTTGSFVEVVSPVIERLALHGIDFPATATSLGFSYRYNFELGVPERSTESLGPVFAERAETVGWHRLDVGLGYLWADLTEFDGEDFGRQIVARGDLDGDDTSLTQTFTGQRFSLTNNIMSVTATFGLTNAWDVNVLQPFIWNNLEVAGVVRARLLVPDYADSLRQDKALDASSSGPGDTLLRTKYRFLERRLASVAAALSLRLPTGDVDDLQGLGDVIVTPTLIISREFGANEVHLNLGVDLNAADSERDRARYALGGSFRPFEHVAFLLDVIGSSSFTDDEFEMNAPRGRLFQLQGFGIDDLVKERRPDGLVAFVPRSDVVDLSLGLKVTPWGRIVGYASVIIPLTSDGLSADVIPAAGLELSF